jgi:hypothetical protein
LPIYQSADGVMSQGGRMLACGIFAAAYLAWEARHVRRWWRDRAAIRQGRLELAMLLDELGQASPHP